MIDTLDKFISNQPVVDLNFELVKAVFGVSQVEALGSAETALLNHKSFDGILEQTESDLKSCISKLFPETSSAKKISNGTKKETRVKKASTSPKTPAIVKEHEKKRNRPGQQARRQKWAEMYGESARHKSSQQEQPPRINTELHSERPIAKPEKALHPSWEAKLKSKSAMKLTIDPNAKPSNKITFDLYWIVLF